MGDEDEDLDQNPFLVALRMRAPDLYKLSADKQFVICCPRRAATGALSLNRTCFETHILQASPFFAGVFMCLNSEKTVDLDGGVIETQRGFRERRRVKILHEDLHYNSDYKPFRVLCISQALEGGGRVVEERRRPARTRMCRAIPWGNVARFFWRSTCKTCHRSRTRPRAQCGTFS